jgi:hypothetical protein
MLYPMYNKYFYEKNNSPVHPPESITYTRRLRGTGGGDDAAAACFASAIEKT